MNSNETTAICFVATCATIAVLISTVYLHNVKEDEAVRDAIIATNNPIGVSCAFGETRGETCRAMFTANKFKQLR